MDNAKFAILKSDISQLSENIADKLDKNQGAANNGKFMQVGADGVLTPASGSTGADSNAVHYNAADGKSDAEKAQARANIGVGFNPIDMTVGWNEPKNYGKKVNGVVGDNIKVYSNYAKDTLVFLGSGEMYSGDLYNDPYIVECLCGGPGNTTVQHIYIQDGITTIGAYAFNRFYQTLQNVYSDIQMVSRVGYSVTNLVLPKSVTDINTRAFQSNSIKYDNVYILGEGEVTFDNQAFWESKIVALHITNATSIILKSNNNAFDSIHSLKTFNSTAIIKSSISFNGSLFLTDDSLVTIANCLETGVANTLTLHATPKGKLTTIVGNVVDGVFTAAAGGATTLQDFITNTKGWTVA